MAPPDQLTIVGVRHHSPACSRLTAATIARVKPRYVLIEGPSDMNARLDELALPHVLPVVLFSYCSRLEETYSSWSPFCEYSPEWVALGAARAAGAQPFFIDLPAWDSAFYRVENRYSDRHGRRSDRIAALGRKLGVEGMDAVWDALFEQPARSEELTARLAVYFEEIRAGEQASERDTRRELYMAQWISWALNEGDPVVVVCGGYHKPALEQLCQDTPPMQPDIPTPPDEGARVGSYLVPSPFRRLDSFAGYESGMPSPGFHQAAWEQGLEAASESMLFGAIKTLRKKGQRVSPADAIAALTLARGLKALRGHEALARLDVLDGLAGALVKHALEGPLPWTQRGTLRAGTDALLVEIVAAFSGEKRGRLALGTPRPPLLADVEEQLDAHGLELKELPRRVDVPIATPEGLARSRVLHRLRVLGIPGITRKRGPSWTRARTELTEEWQLQQLIETDGALIEAAAYGATLEGAAAAQLEEQVRDSQNLAALAAVIFEAALTGSSALTARLLQQALPVVSSEPSLAVLGDALARLLGLWKHDTLLGVAGATTLRGIIEGLFDRGLWLFEGIRGGSSGADSSLVAAIVAIRDALRLGQGTLTLDRAAAHAVCDRRANDDEAPPALRGAALGLSWSTGAFPDAAEGERKAVSALRASARPETLGDFLLGLFAVAREETVHADGLRHALDQALCGMITNDFLIALPALRLAFSYFPPREKVAFAEAILTEHGRPNAPASLLLRATIDAATLLRGQGLEAGVSELARRYGLFAE